MNVRRSAATLAVIGALAAVAGCKGQKPSEVNAIVPSFAVNRPQAPLGSAIEVTYTWTLEPGAKKIAGDYRALVHYLDSHKVVLFTDDHTPNPAPGTWEPGKTYSYKRTVFVPVYPYVGDVQVVMGLYPASGRGERIAMKGEDLGLREYKVSKMEFLPQTENIYLVYKEGWHSPESSPQNPGLERTWTRKEALASFKNPKKDVIVYLEADTNAKAFDQPPVLTVSVQGKAGVTIPIADSEVFLKRIRFTAADLGDAEWVDLKLAMNQSFVPKARGISNTDDRELGMMVYHLYVGEADRLGAMAEGSVQDAAALAPAAAATAARVPAKK